MKLIYIFGIILILALPSTSTGMTLSPSLSTSGHAENYNFSLLPTGSFPANESWIGFHVINGSSSSTESIQKTGAYQGLLVSTVPNGTSGDTFLDVSLKTTGSFNLKLTFSWNSSNNLMFTGDIIRAGTNTSKLISYEFGPDFSSSLYVIGENSSKLGPEPTGSQIFTLGISGTNGSNTVYTDITPGWNESMHIPYIISSASLFDGTTLNILIGGGYSNLTLYNLFLDEKPTGYSLPQTVGMKIYSESNISLGWLPTVEGNSTCAPVVNWATNSMIYLSTGNGSTLDQYNFFNNSRKQVLSFNPDFKDLASYKSGSDAYFLVGNGTASVLATYNATSGNAAELQISHGFSGQNHIMKASNTIYIINESGGIFEITENNGTSGIRNLSLPAGYELLSGQASNDSLYLTYLNNVQSTVYIDRVNPNGSVQSVSSYVINSFDSSLNFMPAATVSPLAYEYALPVSPGSEFVAFYGNNSVPWVFSSNYTVVAAGASYAFLQNSTGLGLFSNGSLVETNIISKPIYVSFSSNLSKGLSFSCNIMTLYSLGSGPFSQNSISIQFSPPRILSGNVSLRYTVNSSVNYTLSASIGNLTLVPAEGYLNFSSVLLTNGTYSLSLYGSNLAGYSARVSTNVSIDNYEPVISLDPANGSFVLTNSTIGISILNLPGTTVATVGFLGLTGYTFQGSQYNITAPDSPGNASLLLNVTDNLGLTRHYLFYFDVGTFNYSSFNTNVPDGAFLPNGTFRLWWTPVNNAVNYTVVLASGHYNFQNNSNINSTNVEIPSGIYELSIDATLQDGETVKELSENFTVQDFSPNLTVQRTTGTHYSFFGNSANNSLNVYLSSNVSAVLWLNVSLDHNEFMSVTGQGDYLSCTLDSRDAYFINNGAYTVLATAKEYSGRESNYTFSFSVNNSLPYVPENGKTFYYNTSTAELPLVFSEDVNYSFHYGNGTPGISFSYGNYSLPLYAFKTDITVTGSSIWGNSNTTNITLIYSGSKPEVNFSTQGETYIWSNVAEIRYTVGDEVTLSSLSLLVNNQTIALSPDKSGVINYTLVQDGNYSLTMNATDLCGNSNQSFVEDISCYYYPEISSIDPTISTFMGISFLESGISGRDLQSVNVSWTIDGKEVSESNSFWALLMPGTHNVTIAVNYHSTEIVKKREVFTLGFLPELAAIIPILSFIVYRKYSGVYDVEKAKELVMCNIGKTRGEILRLARVNKIRKNAVLEGFAKLQSSDRISLMPDPDGVMYVMEGTAGRRGR